MSGVVAVGADPSAAWAPGPLALVVVPVDADAPAAVPAGCPHPVAAVRADAGSIVAAVRAQAPDEVLVDAGSLGELAPLVLVPLRESGVRCAVRAEGAPAVLDAMLEQAADARGFRAAVAPTAVAGPGAAPAPVTALGAEREENARLREEVDALIGRIDLLESVLRGLRGGGVAIRLVARSSPPRVGRVLMRVHRHGRAVAQRTGLVDS